MDLFIDLFGITIDFSGVAAFAQRNPLLIIWEVFRSGGWVLFAYAFLKYAPKFWLWRRQLAWEHHQEFILLAIDVPRGNEQGPKAVENVFSHLAGAHGSQNFYQKWWEGKCQLVISLELVSFGGYVKFIIRTPAKWRDLIETSIYSQYPDAQISEVEDYINSVPRYYPNPTHEMWGSDFILQKNEAYPIRTYIEFEDKLSGELKDPMAAILEPLSHLTEGEQLWFQIVLIPIGQKEWPKHGQHVIDKLIVKEHKPPPSLF